MRRCQEILHEGLRYCHHNDTIRSKAIKHAERMGDPHIARALLGGMRNIDVTHAWRTMLEGAQFEAREGKADVSRKIFKFLMKNVAWYGPIYQAAVQFDRVFSPLTYR